MELKAKLYLVDDEGDKFMGIGVLWLLQQVEQHSSLRKAAHQLGISYSKAFGMVQHLEQKLGVAVLNRRKGGANRDGATLTEFAQEFLSLYVAFDQAAKAELVQPYGIFKEKLDALLEEHNVDGGEQ